MKINDKVKKKIDEWLEYVSLNHHKQRDGIFRIVWEIDMFSLEEVYYAEHTGYVFNTEDDDFKYKFFKSYEEAELDIIRIINTAFKQELKWAIGVLKDKKEYDKDQIKQANWLIKKMR